jgi:hypothetical protein
MMKKLLLILMVVISTTAYPQDTLRVMYHNLLNFGFFTDFCTMNNNNPSDKTQWMKTIVDHYLPDIYAVNEVGTNPLYHNMILNNVMNTSGRTHYQMSQPTNFANSGIINMLYYNSEKLGLAAEEAILTIPRDINVYKLYHKSETLEMTFDTTFLYCFVAHLKAGSSAGDQLQRADMVQEVINYLENNNITDPSVFVGDLNLYSSAEPAWNIITTGAGDDFRFYDPMDMEGNWHLNPDFASVHTQSTRTQSGCGASGGMDDRFDFILTNPAITTTSYPVAFIEGSYDTPGQDGLRFNGSLIDPPNFSLPQDIIMALYNLSDHLPVILDLAVWPAPLPQCDGIMFSAYVNGSGNNKALEIFNAGNSPFDLSDYLIARFAGGSQVADTVGLSGVIMPGGTFLAVVDQRDPEGTGFNTPVDSALILLADIFLCPDFQQNPTMYFTGSDAVALFHVNGEMVDLIGRVGEHPGAGWTTDSLCAQAPYTALCGASPWTAGHTLIRKYSVRQGIKDNPASFNPAAQWIKLPQDDFDSLGFHHSACHPALPASWAYTQTLNSHIVSVPLTANLTVEGKQLVAGDYIGVFYRDGAAERCAGHIKWTNTENQVLVAFGNDPTTIEKDGLDEGDELVWRIFSATGRREYSAVASYDPMWPETNGFFVHGGLSAISTLIGEDAVLTFSLTMAEGWSGVSVPVSPKWPELAEIFGNDTVNLIYMSDGALVYQPGQGINEILNWDSQKGYLVKTLEHFQVDIAGSLNLPATVEFYEGWNILAIPVNCALPTLELGQALEGKIEQIKEIAGIKLYWPANEIATLEAVLPGKAYLIRVNQSCTFTFEDCN